MVWLISELMMPMKVTAIIEKAIAGIPNTCFSVAPVMRCPAGRVAAAVENSVVAFHCMRSASEMAGTYRGIVATRVLTMGAVTPNMSATMPMAVHCVME